MSQTTRVYVFGDQAYDTAELLQVLLDSRQDSLVQSFLELASDILKDEVSVLSPEQQHRCPPSMNVADLLLLWKAGTLNPALSQALSCICHLGTFMLEHGSAGKWDYPTPENACVTGLCTGSLAAVAVSSATNVPDLLPLALQTVAFAFRLGACAWTYGSRFDAVGDGQSWTATVATEGYDSLPRWIAEFTADKALLPSDVPFVSAWIAPSRASISAPPSILNAMLDTEPFRSRLLARLRIWAPYHAPHLFSKSDSDQISSSLLCSVPGLQWPETVLPIISSVTGARIPTMAFPDALRSAAEDCLLRPMRLDLLPGGLASHLKANDDLAFVVCPVAAATPDRLKHFIQAFLGPETLPNTTVPLKAQVTLPAGSNGLQEQSVTGTPMPAALVTIAAAN